MFKGFKPQGLQKIASKMGYTGSMNGFNSYLQQNPAKQNEMNMYTQRAMQMAQGGAVRKMQVGGIPKAPRQEEGMPSGPARYARIPEQMPNLAATTNVGQFQSATLQGVQQVLPQAPNPSGIRPMYEGSQPVGQDVIYNTQSVINDLPTGQPLQNLNALDKQISGQGFYASPAQLQTTQGQPSFNYTKEQALARNQQRDVKSTDEQAAINKALGIESTQPDPRQQAYVPTLGTGTGQTPAYGDGSTAAPDPYADYRQNVEVFPETGTFKNPKIQTSFDSMTEELKRNIGTNPTPKDVKNRSDVVLNYVRNMYSGPIYQSEAGTTGLGGGQFTEEFKQYAADSGLNIVDALAADGSQLLSVQEGSPIATTPGYLPSAPTSGEGLQNVANATANLAQTGAIPVGAVTQTELIQREDGQFIDPNTGQLAKAPDATTTVADTAQADAPDQVTASTTTAATATTDVTNALQANTAAQTNPNDPNAKITAAQQTASSVGNLDAAQGNATLMENPVQREIQDGELISGVADAEKASKFTEQIQAATATPTEKATVQGQLASLTENFDANNPPAWAAGTLRAVQGKLASRGLGASSMAGQAMIQGALESALPIAQADANIQASFEQANLSNRQQRAMLAAEQRATFLGLEFTQEFQARVQNSARIGDIANMNFTAEQNIAMENSRAVNTMNLQNLSNKQGMVMAEASALANLDMSNLSNNQQAAVQNAQNFLQLEMANLSNEQQTALFNAQAINQSILTDASAQNAANQFNASSENQTKQFMANLSNQVSQFNATQTNAQNQFNAGELNTLSRFNAEVRNQRDQFNAQNQLTIAQNNTVWRREIATKDTAALNRANEINAKAVLDVSNTAYNNLWNFYSDTVEWAWRSGEGELDRINALAVAEVSKSAQQYASDASKAAAGKAALGSVIGSIFKNAVFG